MAETPLGIPSPSKSPADQLGETSVGEAALDDSASSTPEGTTGMAEERENVPHL